MESKSKFVLLAFLIVFFLIAVSIFMLNAKYANVEKTEKSAGSELKGGCSDGEKKECVSADGYKGYMKCENGIYSGKCLIASLDQCAIAENQLFNVCCKAKDGSLYDCNEKKSFSGGEYVIIKTNLQKSLQQLGTGWDSYKACGFSKLLTAETEVPKRYSLATQFTSDEVGCSVIFYAKDFHQMTIAGIVPESAGKANLAEVRIYPSDLELKSGNEAIQNIDKSMLVFLFEVDVSG